MPIPSTPSTTWSLDPQLAKDTIEIGDLPLVRTLLMNDANYPWLVLVPRRAGVVEIIDLDDEDQSVLMDEIALIARVLKDVTACDKLNIATIGNIVPQLHVHMVARRRDDAAWPRPVWGAAPPRPYQPAERDRFIAAIRGEVAFG
jgi:diadenosine tetraphosphate (Ap4A) HIT family hydrolase